MFSSPLLPVARTRLPSPVRAWIARRLSGPARSRRTRQWRAILFQLDRVGDLVMATSALRLLLNTWGETECLLVVSDAAAPLAEQEFPRTPRVTLRTAAPGAVRDLVPAWWRERPRLRAHAAERVVCFSHHRDLYKQTALSWVPAQRIHALDRVTYPTAAAADACLELEAHRRLVEAVLGRPVPLAAVIPHLISRRATDGHELLVCPFAEEKARAIPEPLLVATLARWRRTSRADIVLSGTADMAPRLAQLAAAASAAGVANVTVAASDGFDAFLDRIAGAGAVLAVDSAPAHLATALDKPAVILPGGGRFGLASPWRTSARQVVIEHRVPCYGCGWRCTQTEPFCLTHLSAEEIAAALPVLGSPR